MKRRTNKKMNRRVLQGLAGILLSASVFALPMTCDAEAAVEPGKAEAKPVKYVMPQEQIYLDPSQVEAAKQQLKSDAFYNANPQNAAPVVEEKKETIEPAKQEVTQTVLPNEKEKEIKTAAPASATEIKNSEPVTENKTESSKENKTETAKMKPAEPVKEAMVAKKPVRIRRFGVAKEFTTHHATVADVLKDMKINMEGRSSYPPPETKITDGMVIHVLGRKSFVSQEEVEVPFQTQVIDDPELAFGTKRVATAGVKGKDIVTYENITRVGHEQKIEMDRRHVIAPVNEVVRQGVAQSVLTPEGYVRYKKIIYGEATAYTWGGGATGHTSVGLWPKRGIVAVDPRVIPYYTKLFIPGYGMAIAGDTGGAIVGARIDLFMDTLSECFQWGRRNVEIYILE